MNSREIIDNWYGSMEGINLYSFERNNLNQILCEYKTNLLAFRNIETKFYGRIQNSNHEIDYIDLNDCLLFLNLNEDCYNSFVGLIKEFGYISCKLNYDSPYEEREYLSFKAFHSLFGRLNLDEQKRPLFTGISKIQYYDGGHYIGYMEDNMRQGFGTCYYYNEFNFDDIWDGELTMRPTWEEFNIFYSGYWLNDKKEGFGVLAPYEKSNYDYKNYYLFGNWKNDKLEKIFKLNKCMWLDMKGVINEKRNMLNQFLEKDYSEKIDDDISFNDISIVMEEFNTLKFPELLNFSKHLHQTKE